jgi:hypothetical protein
MTTFGDRLFFSNGVPVGGDLLGLLGTGSVWYVDPNSGDDANPGDAPDSAFATLQKALDSTTGTTASSGGFAGGNADVIIRMPGQETVTAAIDADVAPNTTIIASTAGQQLFGDRLNAYTAAAATYTTGPVLRVYFRNVSLYGLAFGGRASTASDAVFFVTPHPRLRLTPCSSTVRDLAQSTRTNSGMPLRPFLGKGLPWEVLAPTTVQTFASRTTCSST